MAISFETFRLTAKDVELSFALVSATLPGVDLTSWKRFVMPLIAQKPAGERPEGAVGLRNPRGYICGVMIYRAEDDLRSGRVLSVDLFIALDFLRERAAVAALLDTVEAIGCGEGYKNARIRIGPEQSQLLKAAQAAGYEAAERIFFKPIAASTGH